MFRVRHCHGPAPATLPERALALVSAGADSADGGSGTLGDAPGAWRLPLRGLGAPMHELWLADEPVSRGMEDTLSWSASGEVIMAQLRLEPPAGGLAQATEAAYRRLYGWLAQWGWAQPWRIWHYFPDITRRSAAGERYHDFVAGRERAFRALGLCSEQYPAATAIGSHGTPFVLQLIAGRARSQPLENPRQVSAYHYPRQYAPAGPAFARARRVPQAGGGAQMLISGTASIVGHHSRHAGDIAAQLGETCANLDALLGGREASAQALRVYLRDARQADAIRPHLRQAFGEHAPLWLLEGTICRDELLVEVDGVWGGR